MADQGIRLQLLIGPTLPAPVSYDVIDALTSVEVTDRGHQQDGFQLIFSMGKDSLLDYSLLASGLLDPPSRVIVVVFINTSPAILIDGLITHHQVQPSNQPGQSRLTVTGVDISQKLDFEDKNATHDQQADSTIVDTILSSYPDLVGDVTSTPNTPHRNEKLPTQEETDLACIQRLAQRNGFVFFVEPTDTLMSNRAYWGPDKREGPVQGVLTMNMGAYTNVDRLDFAFDGLRPEEPTVEVIDDQGNVVSIAIPSDVRPPLAARPAPRLRKTFVRDAARLSHDDGTLRMRDVLTQSWDAVDAQGELDALQYGGVLRACQLVAVRGAGQAHDGTYYVKQVTHNIRRGEYRQSFTLTREGHGAVGLQVGT